MDKIKILYLEDNPNDPRVKAFASKIKGLDDVELTIVNNNQGFQKQVKAFSDACDVIICDIEIWEKAKDGENELTALGFSVLDNLCLDKICYIVTDTTRNFYISIIKDIPRITNIHLKNNVFGNEKGIAEFLDTIKKKVDHKRDRLKETKTKNQQIFEQYYQHIKNNCVSFKLKNKAEEKDKDYSYVEDSVIKPEMAKLQQQWEKLYLEYNVGKDLENKKDNYGKCCKKMQEYIGNNLGFGSSKFHKQLNQTITKTNIENFITKLILRRFYLYVYKIVEKSNIKDSFTGYSNIDLACYAISSENKVEKPPQSHCYDSILLFSFRDEQKTEEEEKFVENLP
jgi:hypothetical protein